MRLQPMIVMASAVFVFAGNSLAIPAPYSDAELEAAATLIVDAEVTEVVCVSSPVTTETNGGTKTVTTYRSTLSVISTTKGTAPTPLTVDGTTTDWSPGSNPPIGGWTQPALKPGLKGSFYLKPAGFTGNLNYAYVWWNALKEADSSAPGDLPDCAGECTPDCDSASCGDDGCGGSCGVCAEGETCGDDGQCAAPPCEPTCVDDGGQDLNCGDDGCGGSCGDCAEGEECTNGMCTKNACDPICGDVACGDDGCGGSCGDCADGDVCGADGQCAACEPSCTQENDGETITLNCGDDGCGGSCGMCDFPPSICEDGVCSQPPCDAITVEGEQMCGINGCGWDWGNCSDGQICGPESFCIDEPGTSGSSGDSGGGCRTANGPVNAGLVFVFTLALLALWIRVRRKEIAPSKITRR